MKDSQQKPAVDLPLGPFLTDLEHHGLEIGVDHYLQIRKILTRIDLYGKSELDVLRDSLCPIVATNASEQALFYHLFDRHFKQLDVPVLKAGFAQKSKPIQVGTPPPIPGQPQPVSDRLFLLMALGVLLLGGILVFGYSEYFSGGEDAEYQTFLSELSDGATNNPPLPEEVLENPDTEPTTSSALDGNYFRHQKFVDPEIKLLEIPNPWWHEFGVYVNWWILICIGGLLLLYEMYLVQRDRIILKHKSQAPEPGEGLLKLNLPLKIRLGQGFTGWTSQLRTRLNTGNQQLDLPATAASTARKSGWLSLEYKEDTRPAEYLILVEQQSANDTRASWVQWLAQQLQTNGLHLEVFFFEPYSSEFKHPGFDQPVSIRQLQFHYGGHRLILVSSGRHWLDGTERQLLPHWQQLTQWSERALLTTVPREDWGKQEHELATHFPVLTADRAGWMALGDLWQEHTQVEFPADQSRPDRSMPAFQNLEELNNWLQAIWESDFDMFKTWFYSCCLYPGLNWDLFIGLGNQLQDPTDPLLTWERIDRMFEVPWIAKGKIPVPVRELVLLEVDWKQTPYREALDAITSLLEQQIKPGQAPSRMHRLHLRISKALGAAGRERHKIIREARMLYDSMRLEDQPTLTLLSRSRFRALDLLLHSRLLQPFYRDHVPYRGLNRSIRLGGAIVAIGLPLLLMDLEVSSCRKLHFTYNSHDYCPRSGEKMAIFRTHRSAFFQHPKPMAWENIAAYSQLTAALESDSNYAPALINVFLNNYNKGINQFSYRKDPQRLQQALDLWSDNLVLEQAVRDLLTQNIQSHQQRLDERTAQNEPADTLTLYGNQLLEFKDFEVAFEQHALDNQHAYGLALLFSGQRSEALAVLEKLGEDYFDRAPQPNLQTALDAL